MRHKRPFLHQYTSCAVAPEREERRRSPEEATDSRFDVLNFGSSRRRRRWRGRMMAVPITIMLVLPVMMIIIKPIEITSEMTDPAGC